MTALGLCIAILLFGIGLLAILFPIIPGSVVIFMGIVIYCFCTSFASFTTTFIIGQLAAVALTFLADFVANVWGVKRYGGSKAALWGSLAGTVLGVITMGPIGVILGPFLGAFTGELIAERELAQAVHVGVGTLIGLLGSTAIKLAISGFMIVWFFMTI